jgi:hypothetical protein
MASVSAAEARASVESLETSSMPVRSIAAILAVLLGGACCASAEENIVGRTLPGVWVTPQGGVVGASSGLSFTVMPIGYIGSMSASQEAIINGVLVAGLSMNMSENLLIPQYTYKLRTKKIGLASSAYIPINWAGVAGSLLARGGDFGGSTTLSSTYSSSAGIGDVFFSPLTLGVHFSETSNLAIDTKIFAPTGAFQVGNLSNLGMNEWTFMPNATYTYMKLKKGIEITNNVGLDIYTQNPTNKYKSGTAFHWDGLFMQYLSKKGGVGAIISNVTQITNDTGPLSNRLNGFKGRAWGAGPIVLYTLKDKNPQVIFQFRWINEFAVSNRTNGNTLLLGLTLQL